MTPLVVLLATLTIVTLCYIGVCYATPFTRCIACRISPGDHFCRWCGGTGYRPRLGWQAYNALSRLYRDANH